MNKFDVEPHPRNPKFLSIKNDQGIHDVRISEIREVYYRIDVIQNIGIRVLPPEQPKGKPWFEVDCFIRIDNNNIIRLSSDSYSTREDAVDEGEEFRATMMEWILNAEKNST